MANSNAFAAGSARENTRQALSPEQVASISAVRLEQQQREPVSGQFNVAHLQAIHNATFRDIVADAGLLRETGLSKAQPDGRVVYLESESIRSGLNGISARIDQYNRFKDLPKEDWSKAIAATYSDLNAVHPFRDGNERVAREFVRQLGKEAGFDVDYTKVDPAQWKDATSKSFDGKQAPLAAVFASISEPTKERAIALSQQEQGKDSNLAASLATSRGFTEQFAGALRQDSAPREIDTAGRAIGLSVRNPQDVSAPVKGNVVAETKDHYLVQVSPGLGIALSKSQDAPQQMSRGDIVVLAPAGSGSLSVERAPTEKDANTKVLALQQRPLDLGERA
jgi:cell filamentation protein